jgi:hypothetical protein
MQKKIIVFYFPAVLLLIPNISSSVNWGVPHGLHKIALVSLSLTASIYRAHKLAYVPSLLLYTPWWNGPLTSDNVASPTFKKSY